MRHLRPFPTAQGCRPLARCAPRDGGAVSTAAVETPARPLRLRGTRICPLDLAAWLYRSAVVVPAALGIAFAIAYTADADWLRFAALTSMASASPRCGSTTRWSVPTPAMYEKKRAGGRSFLRFGRSSAVAGGRYTARDPGG